MLYALWLLLYGSWQQTLINLDNKAPATGLSSGWYYGVGIFFSIAAGLLVLRNIYEVADGEDRGQGPDPGAGVRGHAARAAVRRSFGAGHARSALSPA